MKRSIVEYLADSTANHRIAAPIAWGLLSGLTGGPMMIGSTITGYIVGRAGVGRGLSILAFASGSVLIVVRLIRSSLPTCPSCVDAYIMAPVAIPILLVPFLIGMWLGGRARKRSDRVKGSFSGTIGAVLVGLAGAMLTASLFLIGMFSDWSGQHQWNWPSMVAGLAAAALTVVVVRRAFRGT